MFRSNDDEHGLHRDTSYRVDAIDSSANTLRLLDPQGQAIISNPGQGGADQAEAYAEVAQEFRTGDRIQFTRNNYRADRKNGHTASVVAVDPQGSSMTVERQDGRREMIDLAHLADRHIRPGWVRTIHSAQGATAERVVAHLESFRPNTVDAPTVYAAISRAKTHASIYTDSRADLTHALGLRDGAQVGALDAYLHTFEF